jgi:5-methylcytosine-specific restriction enzyme A
MSDLKEALRPKSHARVIDLVQQAGLSVEDWANYSRGAQHASVNPKYCYEWCFVDEGLTVLCLWHEEVVPSGDTLAHRDNFRPEFYVDPDGKASWKLRAKRLDDAVRTAFDRRSPVRVIFNAGKRRRKGEGEQVASRVQVRLLDPEPWFVTGYDYTSGNHEIVRGRPVAFVDQFSADIGLMNAERRSRLTQSFVRSADVRTQVLKRAAGHCEYCGEPGFLMPSGQRYLETHHIIALSKDGSDRPDNVIALCPNHHREAHYGIGADAIAAKLVSIALS